MKSREPAADPAKVAPYTDRLSSDPIPSLRLPESEKEIETRCVNMVAALFHAEGLSEGDATSATGVSTIGSSGAVMLAGLAMKRRWRKARESAGKDASKPNFDVEPRYLPMKRGATSSRPVR